MKGTLNDLSIPPGDLSELRSELGVGVGFKVAAKTLELRLGLGEDPKGRVRGGVDECTGMEERI